MEFSNGAVDVLGLHEKQKNLLILLLYRQPDNVGGNRSTSRDFKEALHEIQRTLSKLQAPHPEVIMCGDFNLPHLSWPSGNLGLGACKEERVMAQYLEELCNDHFLFQQITRPTHRLGNTLDLCFSNNPQLMHDYHCRPTIHSDHYIIEGSASFKAPSENQENFRQPSIEDGTSAIFDTLNFFSEDVNWNELDEDISRVDWDEVFQSLDPSAMFDKLIETCSELSKKHVPQRSPKKKSRSRIPRSRRILMRRRSKVNKQLASSI